VLLCIQGAALATIPQTAGVCVCLAATNLTAVFRRDLSAFPKFWERMLLYFGTCMYIWRKC